MMRAVFRFRLPYWTALLILVAGDTYGCEDFMDIAPQGRLDESTLTNAAGVEGTLIAAYRMLDIVWGGWGTAASNWIWGSVTSDDAYKGSEATDGFATDIEMYYWTSGWSEDLLNDKWVHTYEAVARANATLRLLGSVVEKDPDEISQSDQDGIRGEALVLRAHYYFEAWRMWQNIPYHNENDTDFRKTNVGVDVVDSILRDLDQAISLLPETPRKGEVGRVTRWTAKAYMGRVQIYAGDYAGVVTTLEDVRQNGPYALQPNFYQVWSAFAEYQNGPETILAYQANHGDRSGMNANYGEQLNYPHSGSPFGCCGFHQPSQNLVNFFAVDADGLPLAVTDPVGWNDRDDNLDATASAAMRLDPRLDWTVGRDGVPYKDWGPHEPDWIRAPAYGGPYSPKKNVYEDASGAVSFIGYAATQLSNMNMHIFRYADMLLLLAEAYVEVGRLEDARAIVNEIRARAGQAAQGCGLPASATLVGKLLALYPQCAGDARIAVPLDDPSIAWADYGVGLYQEPWADQEFARTVVRYERRLELAMEGERFFDLRRWGIAQQVLTSYLLVEQNRRVYLRAAAPYTSRHALFPIPNVQIELSRVDGEDRLVQNPGW